MTFYVIEEIECEACGGTGEYFTTLIHNPGYRECHECKGQGIIERKVDLAEALIEIGAIEREI